MAAATAQCLFQVHKVPTSTTTYTAKKAVATAHVNEQGLDIIQIINQGGKVVWSLDSAGVPHVNPTSPSQVSGHYRAAFAQYFGSSLAAISNSLNLDLYQVHDGSKVVFHVDHLGNAVTP